MGIFGRKMKKEKCGCWWFSRLGIITDKVKIKHIFFVVDCLLLYIDS